VPHKQLDSSYILILPIMVGNDKGWWQWQRLVVVTKAGGSDEGGGKKRVLYLVKAIAKQSFVWQWGCG